MTLTRLRIESVTDAAQLRDRDVTPPVPLVPTNTDV